MTYYANPNGWVRGWKSCPTGNHPSWLGPEDECARCVYEEREQEAAERFDFPETYPEK